VAAVPDCESKAEAAGREENGAGDPKGAGEEPNALPNPAPLAPNCVLPKELVKAPPAPAVDGAEPDPPVENAPPDVLSTFAEPNGAEVGDCVRPQAD
jgi:hypothetical protein